MMAIARAAFRSITRSPSAVVFSIAFPLIFILVFGFISGGRMQMKLAVSNEAEHHPLVQSLSKISSIKIIVSPDSAFLLNELSKAHFDGLILLHQHNPAQLKFKTTSASPEKGALLQMIIENSLLRYNLSQAHLEGKEMQLISEQVAGRAYKAIDFILPGQLGFSLLSTGVFGTAFVFFNLRQTLVIKRFFATPVSRPSIILGECIARVLFAIIGAVFIITVGYLFFGFTLVHGIQTALTMLGIALFGLTVFMGFGFIVSGLAKSESVIPPIANIITLPQFLLSGTFFSIENFPSWLQPICKILPLTWLNDAMRLVAFEGASFLEILPKLAVVALWGVVVYAVAFRTFRWE
jgi:ABC-2 type transport system permease protein